MIQESTWVVQIEIIELHYSLLSKWTHELGLLDHLHSSFVHFDGNIYGIYISTSLLNYSREGGPLPPFTLDQIEREKRKSIMD